MDDQPEGTAETVEARRRRRATEIAERALLAAGKAEGQPPIQRIIEAVAVEVEYLMLDAERRQMDIDGLVVENEKLRTTIAGNEREAPPEVMLSEQSAALVSILAEAHRRAQIGSLRSIALFWREGREVFIRANTRPPVSRPGDGKPDLVGLHGNHPWAAYFDPKQGVVAVRVGTAGSAAPLWEKPYRIGPAQTVQALVIQALGEFDRWRMI